MRQSNLDSRLCLYFPVSLPFNHIKHFCDSIGVKKNKSRKMSKVSIRKCESQNFLQKNLVAYTKKILDQWH